MFTIKNEVCFLKICSQYAKRKINNTVRVCSSQTSSVRHLPHPSLLRHPFRQSTNTPTHPLGDEIAPYFGPAENSNLIGKK